ncbi:hypothetical protein VPH35_104090 [Triticum aestivum]|uniref:Uncharacterized protein n=1 Tax=Triticum urartu TaxID=4572 RepID=A0A8R7URK7_TRIUA
MGHWMLIPCHKHTRSELEICSIFTRIKPQSAAFDSFHNKAGKAIQTAEASRRDAPDPFFPPPSNILQVNIILCTSHQMVAAGLLEIIRWRQCRRYPRQNSVAGLTAPRIFRRSRTTPSRTRPAVAAASQAPPACGRGHVSPSSACSTSPEHRRIRRFARPCAGPPPLCSLRPVCRQK